MPDVSTRRQSSAIPPASHPSPAPANTSKRRTKAPKADSSARKNAKYVVVAGGSAKERLETLKAAFSEADEQIEGAYDAANPGSALECLLDHVSHDLLAVAINPMLKEQPTRADAEKTRRAMTVTLAALQGVMTMVADSPLAEALQEGFELLDWIQRECEAFVLEKALPEPDLAADFARGRDHAIAMMEECVAIGDEREGWRWLREGKAQENLVDGYLTDVIEDLSLRPGFTAVLSAALQNDTCLSAFASMTLAEVQAGKVGANGTSQFTGDEKLAMTTASTTEKPSSLPQEVVGILTSHEAPDGQYGPHEGQELRRRLAADACYELEVLVPLVVRSAHDDDTSGRLYPIIRGMMRRIGELNDVIFDAVITTEPNHTARVLCDKLGLSNDDMHRDMARAAEVSHA